MSDDVELVFGELVVPGGRVDRAAIADAFEAELTRLLHEAGPGGARSLAGMQPREVLHGDAAGIDATLGADELGRAVARAVHQGLLG